ncbi:MAG: helix-turn-helix domain-containing protein, partial [Propionibacteriaceae bacterium]|nr:helix-turn-helix domain-containing protein [Propionibacteriaceae bacterium]
MDVARAAGVSRASVSKVIRDAYGVSPTMKARVEKTIADLDYRPRAAARAMRGLSYTLGFEI